MNDMGELKREEKLMYIAVGDYEADRNRMEALEQALEIARRTLEAVKFDNRKDCGPCAGNYVIASNALSKIDAVLKEGK